MRFCRLVVTSTAFFVFLGATLSHAAEIGGDECSRYMPQIGKTVRVPCAESEPSVPRPPPPLAPAAAATDGAPGERTLLGIKLSTLTPELRDAFKVEATIGGVLVTDVDVRSEAAGRGIRRGDVIMQTNEGVVASPDDVARSFESAAKSGRKTILLLVKNADGEVAFVALPLS